MATTIRTKPTPSKTGVRFESRSGVETGDGSRKPPMVRLYYRRKSGLLFAAHEETINPDGRASNRPAEFEVVADFRDVEENFLQIAGYGDFFNRVSQLAAGNPEARCSA